MAPRDEALDDGLSARLARVARATPHAVIVCDADGAIQWVNDGFTQICGYALDEVAGRRPGDFLQCAESDPYAIAAMSAALEANQGVRVELINRAKDGRLYWVDLDIRPTLGADGACDGAIAIAIDVTGKRDLQNRLKRTSVALRSAGKLAQVGGWEVDLIAGAVRWSQELHEMLGRPEDVESTNLSLDAYHPEDRGRVHDAVVAAIQDGGRVDLEARAINGAGEVIWLHIIGEPEFIDGKCVAVRGASQDITEQRRAVNELRESERFSRGIIDGVGAMLTVIDETGAIIEANRAFRDLGAEITKRETYELGRNLFAVISGLPGRHGRVLEKGLRAVLEGRVENFSRAYSAISGEWFRMTATRFAGEGPVRCVVFTQSIADLKRSEDRLRVVNANLKRARDAANAANAAKSAFLATMSHEIRTPLNGVLGMAQAMANDELPPVQRERLAVVRQAGETLLLLLNDLLDLSRIEAGRLDLEDGCVDIAELARGVQANFGALAREKQLRLDLSVAPQVQGLWRGDPTRVRQVLGNLVSNAVKFTAAGAVTVDVRRVGSKVVFEVADTGPGIPAERLSHLFDKFVQADASTTRRYGGSGLGLAICRQLATLMGGDIEVRSTLGEGSVFTLRLPLTPLAEGAGAVQAAPALEESEQLGAAGPRVLAADDNPMNQLVLKTLLGQLGIEVHVVADGQQALDAAAEGGWDVILMDVQMPVMDGPAAAQRIRALEAALSRPRTPIVALTANAMDHQQREYLAAGMDAVVPKPIELARLVATLNAVLAPADDDAVEAVG